MVNQAIHISYAGPFYRFDGRLFEVHRYLGPVPLKKDGEPSQRPPGRSFWRTWEKFVAPPESEREKYRVKI